MSEFDILMVCMVVACLGFASWIVTLSQKVKQHRYDHENLVALVKQLQAHHQDQSVMVERKLTNLGQ